MVRITLDIDGMTCEACENRIDTAVKRAFRVKKSVSSSKSGATQIIAEKPIDDECLKEVVEQTGYKILGIHTEPYVKKGIFNFR